MSSYRHTVFNTWAYKHVSVCVRVALSNLPSSERGSVCMQLNPCCLLHAKSSRSHNNSHARTRRERRKRRKLLMSAHQSHDARTSTATLKNNWQRYGTPVRDEFHSRSSCQINSKVNADDPGSMRLQSPQAPTAIKSAFALGDMSCGCLRW